MPHQSRLNN